MVERKRKKQTFGAQAKERAETAATRFMRARRVAITFAMALAACSKPSSEPTKTAKTDEHVSPWEATRKAKLALSVSVLEMARDYMDNKVAGATAYEGKYVEVLGTMDKPDSDGTGTFVPISARGLDSKDVREVRCYVSLDDPAQKAAVSGTSSQRARVRGRVGALDLHAIPLTGCVVDTETLGKDEAEAPTVPYVVPPPRGTPRGCAMLEACCPNGSAPKGLPKSEEAVFELTCISAAKTVRNKRETETCDGMVDRILSLYKDERVKAPEACRSLSAPVADGKASTDVPPTPTTTAAPAPAAGAPRGKKKTGLYDDSH